MKTFTFCPISDKMVNERVARVNAAFTVFILIAFAYTQSILLIIFLAVDFLLRASDYSRFSIIGMASRNILKYLPLKENLINAGPKILAARIGLVITTLIVAAFLSAFNILTLVLAGILTLFSSLEGAFGLCVACKVYPYIYQFLYKRKF